MAEARSLIEGILMAALALTLLACRHRIVDYIIGRIDMKRRDALARQALVIKRKYRAARADEDWPNAMRLQQVYRRITGTIARLDRAMKAKEKAPGKVGNPKGFQVAQRLPTAQSCGLRRGTDGVAAPTESRSNKTIQVYHDSGEDAR